MVSTAFNVEGLGPVGICGRWDVSLKLVNIPLRFESRFSLDATVHKAMKATIVMKVSRKRFYCDIMKIILRALLN